LSKFTPYAKIKISMTLINDLTKQFGKKNIPDIRPGDTVRISFKVTEAGKTRLQTFEGICIAKKHGNSLNGSFSLRKVSFGIGVERTFPLHSPLVSKIEKIKSRRVKQAKLYFIRDLMGKKSKKIREKKDYQMWEEALSEAEIKRIQEDKEIAAQKKAEKKAKKQQELEAKFTQAIKTHKEAENVAEQSAGESGGGESVKVPRK
jgi:large subunit ribosomal protein L19